MAVFLGFFMNFWTFRTLFCPLGKLAIAVNKVVLAKVYGGD